MSTQNTAFLVNAAPFSGNHSSAAAPGATAAGGQVSSDPIEEMNSRFALIRGRTEIWDIKNFVAMKVEAFRLHCPMSAKFWLDSNKRRSVWPKDIVFAPGGCLPHQINIFDQSKMLKPDPNKSCHLLLSHIYNMCGQDQGITEYLISWLAFPLCHLGAKMATAIVIHGAQGTGKNLFFEAYMKIFGDYATIIDQDTLESDFNGWASGKMFAIADEVISNANKANVRNRLKSLITGSQFYINRKGIEAHEEANHMNLVFLSNSLVPLLLENDDRRYFVIRFDKKYDPQYYQSLADEIKAGGAEGLYHFLLNWKFPNFSGPHQKPPMTLAKNELINQCLTTPVKFMNEWLSGDLPVPAQPVKANELYDLYTIWCKEKNEFKVSSTRFGTEARDRCEKIRIPGGGNCYVPSTVSKPTKASDIKSIDAEIRSYIKKVRTRDQGA